MNVVGNIGCGAVVLAVVLVFVAIGAWLLALPFGWYGYDYRCNGQVVEQHLEVYGIPFGGWEAVDGDAAGGCP